MKERWDQVKQILHDASELPSASRQTFVHQAANGDPELIAEVESLLLSLDNASEFLEDAPVQLSGFGDSLAGRWIGEYRIEKLIAKGGMGSVYLATKQMDGVPMQVALKLIRYAGDHDYLTRRFRLERQILARLTHENILRLTDGGVSADGLPYIVTEFLDAQNLEHWLTNEQPTLSTRLKVFQRICDGVAYAHRNLIVHGDIKPSNILITRSGIPKLVDFGIARLLSKQDDGEVGSGDLTITMTPALTPWWASPEQLRGEPLSMESDCYALGRILFLLLCGQKPFDFTGLGTQQILDMLRHQPPPKPSSLTGDARIAGDLDNIAVKALEFERDHRYRSVDALSDDIGRHLAMLPVSARPQTWSYRLQKFVRRNKGLVAVVSTASLALLLALGFAFYQARQARKNYESSRERLEQLRALANSLVFEADRELVKLQGATPVRARLVKSALSYLDKMANQDNSDPRMAEELADAYEKIGDIQGQPGATNLGQTAQSLESYRKSEAIREAIRRDAKKAPDFIRASDHLAQIYVRISASLRAVGDVNGGLSYERKALGIRQALFEGDPENLSFKRAMASSLTTLSGSLSQLGDYQGVLETRREALKMHEEIVARDPGEPADLRSLALALARMASIEMHENAIKESLAHYQRALDIDRRLLERDPGNVQFQLSAGWSHANYALILHRMGKAAEALEQYQVSRGLLLRVAQADTRDVRSKTLLETNRVHTAQVLLSLGRVTEALSFAQTALGGRLRLAEQNRSNAGAEGEVAEAYAALGQCYVALRQTAKARESFQTAQQLLEDLIRSERANAAMKDDLASVRKELSTLSLRVQ